MAKFSFEENDKLIFEDLILDDKHFHISSAWDASIGSNLVSLYLDKDGLFDVTGNQNQTYGNASALNQAAADLIVSIPAGTPNSTGYQAITAAYSGATTQQQTIDMLINKGILGNEFV